MECVGRLLPAGAACSVCTAIRDRTQPMRINIEIDDKLMSEALRATGAKTKREAVELSLRTVVRVNEQARIRHYRGRLTWEGDLDGIRTDV